MAFKGRRKAQEELINDSAGVSINDDDITNLAYKNKKLWSDSRTRLSVYIDSDTLAEFRGMAGARMQSEIVERLLEQFVADVKAKENVNTSWDIPE